MAATGRNRIHAAGVVGRNRRARTRDPERAPVFVGGQAGEYFAGAYASAATITSRHRRIAVEGELLDLSMLETQILGLTYYPVSYFEVLGRPWRDARRLTVPGVAQAKDGLVDIGCGTAQQWFDLCAMAGHPEWIDEASPLTITEQANVQAEESTPGWPTIRSTRSATSPPRSASRTRQWPTARISPLGPLPSAVVRRQPARRFPSARPSLPDATRTAPTAATGAAAGGAHRTIPASRPARQPGAGRLFGRVAVQGLTCGGHDDLLGRPELHALSRHARRRGDPRRIDP